MRMIDEQLLTTPYYGVTANGSSFKTQLRNLKFAGEFCPMQIVATEPDCSVLCEICVLFDDTSFFGLPVALQLVCNDNSVG